MSGKDAINKEKGIKICADMLYEGKQRAEIVQHFANTYNIKARTVDNYIKEGRLIKDKRLAVDEEVRAKVQAEQTEELARKLGITRENMLARILNTVDLDWRLAYQENGELKPVSEWPPELIAAISAIESTEVRTAAGRLATVTKVKRDPRLTAIDMINKMMGYYPGSSVKVEAETEGGKGKEKQSRKVTVTLNLT